LTFPFLALFYGKYGFAGRNERMQPIDDMRILDRIIDDIKTPKRLRAFKSFEALIRKEGSVEAARRYRKIACQTGLARRCNKTAKRPAGMVLLQEARELRKK